MERFHQRAVFLHYGDEAANGQLTSLFSRAKSSSIPISSLRVRPVCADKRLMLSTVSSLMRMENCTGQHFL